MMKHYFKELLTSLVSIRCAELAQGVWFQSK